MEAESMRRMSLPRQAGHSSPAHRCSMSVTPGEQSLAAPHPSQRRHPRCTAMKAGASAQVAGNSGALTGKQPTLC